MKKSKIIVIKKCPQAFQTSEERERERAARESVFPRVSAPAASLLCVGSVRDAERVGPGNSWSCYFYTCATARGIEGLWVVEGRGRVGWVEALTYAAVSQRGLCRVAHGQRWR